MHITIIFRIFAKNLEGDPIMAANKIKGIPYGVSDFTSVINRNLYYVDKTRFIPELENQADNLFFIRPRRFGKSLFINMLRTYYDCQTTPEKFQELFGNLWIGQHPTDLQGKFQILYLDFSQVGGDIDNLEKNFDSYCKVCFDYFVNKYEGIYSQEFIKQVHAAANAMDKLTLINAETQRQNLSLYLIIDEYDNYCFSRAALKKQSKVFNCDMVIYYLHHYINDGEPPREMIDPNTKTDYGKMENLLQLDQLDGDRKGIIKTIAEKGQIHGNIMESFPAKALTDPEIFVSLLFYYGMLTIKGTFGDQLILGIPNNNVRKQYLLLAQYQKEN